MRWLDEFDDFGDQIGDRDDIWCLGQLGQLGDGGRLVMGLYLQDTDIVVKCLCAEVPLNAAFNETFEVSAPELNF